MFQLRSFRMWLTLALVFTLGVPWQPLTLTTSNSTAVQAQTRSIPATRSDAPLADQMATADLQKALDLLVNQALAGLGWKVASLNSQLDTASLTGSVTNESGSGQWTLQAQDDQGQSVTLQGILTFQSGSEKQIGAFSANAKMKGVLSGSGVTLDLDLSESGDRSRDAGGSTLAFAIKVTRNGVTHNVKLNRSIMLDTIAYGVSRTINHTTIMQDGQTHTWDQTITARNFAKGESEIWLQSALSAGANQPTDMTLSQHFYQRGSNDQLTQYIDQYDLKIGGQSYSLQAPATAQAGMDGVVKTNIVLIDSQGHTLTPPASGGGLQSPAAIGSLRTIATSAEVKAALAIARMLSLDSTGAYMPPLSLCGDLTSNTGSFLIGVAASIAAAYLFGAEIILFDLIVGNLATTIIGVWQQQALANATTQEQRDAINAISLLLQLGIGFAGITSPGGVAGLLGNFASFLGGAGAGKACNGDPYFLYPDVRSISTTSTAPIEITRVTGGLLVISNTIASAATEGPAQPIRSVTANEYNDRSEVFVGGSIPSGATSIGTWNWDATQTFGAAASHTAGLIDGPNKHYFIHAANPLNITTDDNIIQYVYIDSKNPPDEILLQFYTGDGDGEHRVMWGGDQIQTGGKAGTASLYPAGALPPTGQWIRLRVPADQIDLAGHPINGVLYGSYGGQVWWGATTTSSRLTDNSPEVLQVHGPQALPQTIPGAQIAFILSQAASVNLKIVNATGSVVKTLLSNQDRSSGYQVAVWNATDDNGKLVSDARYQYQLTVNGQTLSGDVSISPFVANIQAPTSFGIVRGNNVPIIGEAYGPTFISYTLDYGEGLSPTNWQPIIQSQSPIVLPPVQQQFANLNAGNLANWDTGINEFRPWNIVGLNGIYTLRLTVAGQDGRTALDREPVVVGRLAHSAEGGTITSSDGKARLLIPPLATDDSFALMAILPESQVDPSNTYRSSLPGDKQLSSDVYEIFPPDETFREPATLELPYNAGSAIDKFGVMIGDGTPPGWHYLGGTVDAAKQVIRVPITEFGGKRAFAAVFTSDNFGDPQPYRTGATPFTFDTKTAAPIVSSSTAPVAFYTDFESAAGEWAALDQFGTQLSRVSASAAGESSAGNVLKVTHLAGGARLVQVRSTPYNALQYPLIVFDYRAPADYAPNLLVKSNGYWWQFKIGTDGFASSKYYQNINLPALTTDDQWHHAQIDVLGYLRAEEPETTSFQIDEVVLGQMWTRKYMQVLPLDNGDAGSVYYIDNFAALAPINQAQIPLSWTSPAGVNYSAYSTSFDQQADTQPAASSADGSTKVTVSMPNNANDGLWYFHVRGKNPSGQWSAATHYPVLIDRQPPTLGEVMPDANGAGGPNFIQVAINDATGLDLSKLQLQIDNKPIGIGRGVIYDPEFSMLQIQPYGLKTPLPAIPNGQKVNMSVSVSDYAGNAIASPFSWAFTADVPKVSGDQFRGLTKNGGESPALSPDGSALVFVTARSGVSQLWLVNTSDYGESSNSAHQLIAGNAHTFDAAWSADGKSIAFVSDATGSNQIWISDQNGGGAKAITSIDGSIGSPTWSPDAHTLAFVRNGNIWQVNADGTALKAITTYPDAPIQKVEWQPNGNVLAVDYKLYQETIELYDLATNQLTPLTNGGVEHDPAWLNYSTILYAAPQALNQPDAIWKIDTDGSAARMIEGSGQPGVADIQPSAATDGSSIAMVSTRNGTRDIFLQATLQIARFDVSPLTGIVPGDQLQINYSLPVDAEVTLQVLGVDGKPLKTLLDNVNQSKGVQLVTWDGLGSDGKPVPFGDYDLKLSATIAGEAIERHTSARVLDASNIGQLHVQINQWTGQPAAHLDLRVDIYPSGPHLSPAVPFAYGDSQTYKLAAGLYDAIVTYQGQRYEFDRLQVQAQQTANQTLDLHLGGLQVSVVSAPGQMANDAFVHIVHSGDPTSASIAFDFGGVNNFVLPPGLYDIYAEYQGVRKTIDGIEVKTAQTTQQEVNLGSGTLHFDVSAYDGQAALAGNLIVYAFRPDDHTQPIGQSLFSNPFNLLLPAGVYDLLFKYGLGDSSGGGGELQDWQTGVDVQSGEAISLTHNFHLGEAQIDLVEAAGKAVDPNLTTFYIYRSGDLTTPVAQGLFAATGKFQLPPGDYQVVAKYYTTNIDQINPPSSLHVTEGQASSLSINLHAGRVQLEVEDAPGRATDKNRVVAYAYPAGKRDSTIASVVFVNPMSLILPAGVPFDIDLSLDSGKHLILTNQIVQEGQTLTLNVNAGDFK